MRRFLAVILCAVLLLCGWELPRNQSSGTMQLLQVESEEQSQPEVVISTRENREKQLWILIAIIYIIGCISAAIIWFYKAYLNGKEKRRSLIEKEKMDKTSRDI